MWKRYEDSVGSILGLEDKLRQRSGNSMSMRRNAQPIYQPSLATDSVHSWQLVHRRWQDKPMGRLAAGMDLEPNLKDLTFIEEQVHHLSDLAT